MSNADRELREDDWDTPPIQVGGSFGRYRVLSQLGEGGMGWVYLAHDELLQREVALKIPRIFGDSARALGERFLTESRAAARIDHPNICPIYDAGTIDGVLYLTMRRVRGETLSKHLERGPMRPLEAAQLTHKLASALSAIHSHGILHRDIKTLNILLDEQQEPLLTDFGLARLPEVSSTESVAKSCRDPRDATGSQVDTDVKPTSQHATDLDGDAPTASCLLGTLHYLAPELLNRSSPEPRTDIYALGVVLYKTLTGWLPYQGTPDELVAAIASQPPTPPSLRTPGIPPALDAICLKCLAKEANDRYQSAAEMAAALRQYMYPEEKAEQERRVRNIYRRVRSARLLTAVAIAAAVWMLIGSGTLELQPIDPGSTVSVDGELVAIPPGATSHTIPVGWGWHTIRVTGPTFEDRTTNVFIWRRGEQRTVSASVLLRRIETLAGGKVVAALCGSPDGSTIYATYCNFPDPSPVLEFAVESGQIGRAFAFPNISFDHKGIAISPDSRYLFVSNYHQRSDDDPREFDRQDVSRIDLQGDGTPVQLNVGGFWGADLVATPDGRWLVVALGGDGRNKIENNEALALVNIEAGRFEFVQKVPLDDEPCRGTLALAPKGHSVYTATAPRKSASPKLYEIPLRAPFEVARNVSFPGSDLRSVVVSDELSRIYIADATSDKGVRVLDVATFTERTPLPLPAGYFPALLALHPNGELLAVLCKDSSTIFLFEPRADRLCAKLTGLDRQIASMVFSPHGKQIWLVHNYPRTGISILDVSRTFQGATVVFTSDRGGEGRSLHRMNADGSSMTQLSEHHAQDSSPRWNPNGTRLAFVSNRHGPARIFIADEFAQNVKCLESTNPITDLSCHGLDWSPDGKSIAFIDASYQKINRVDIASGIVQTIWDGPVEDHYDRHLSVSWNRVTDTIIFSTRNSATAEKYHDVFSLDPRTETVTRLTDHRDKVKRDYFLACPVVSPDGTAIAVTHTSRHAILPPHDIWILNLDGTIRSKIAATSKQYCGPASWSADGKYLYYAASDSAYDQRDLYRVPLDGGPPEQLTWGHADDVDPDVGPSR